MTVEKAIGNLDTLSLRAELACYVHEGGHVDLDGVREVLKARHRALMLKYHPDRNGFADPATKTLAERFSREVNGAADVRNIEAKELTDAVIQYVTTDPSSSGDTALLESAMMEIVARDEEIASVTKELRSLQTTLYDIVNGRIGYRPEQILVYNNGRVRITLANADTEIPRLIASGGVDRSEIVDLESRLHFAEEALSRARSDATKQRSEYESRIARDRTAYDASLARERSAKSTAENRAREVSAELRREKAGYESGIKAAEEMLSRTRRSLEGELQTVKTQAARAKTTYESKIAKLTAAAEGKELVISSAYAERVEQLRREGYLTKALSLAEHVLEVDPNSPQLHFSLGLIYLRQGEMEKATDHYVRGIIEGVAPTMDAALTGFNRGNLTTHLSYFVRTAVASRGKLTDETAELVVSEIKKNSRERDASKGREVYTGIRRGLWNMQKAGFFNS
ncbi:hypothetical protein COY27_04150 [Candidatus Woesearchaeota archaeon CG_4_10_14_0_2_um_filter_33_13]|nr:MAG: hypothetical protein COY27_04150 [Candidatus Woesearchaeota archaeon CG_4_10_14_0_2_um_filter_33_13]